MVIKVNRRPFGVKRVKVICSDLVGQLGSLVELKFSWGMLAGL